ncbi:MAG: mechanosensitive ion channel domain-containing protein [Pseudomonadota bacterium]
MAARFFSILILAFALAFPAVAHAQSVITSPSTTNASSQAQGEPANPFGDPSAWIRILDTTEQAVAREGVTDAELDRLFDETGSLRQAANVEAQDLQGRVDRLRQQLEELGAPPAEGEPEESPEAKQLRETLNQSFADVDARLKIALNASTRARQVQKQIGDLRHTRFIQSISIRTPGLTSAGFWSEFVTGFRGFYRSLRLLIRDSFSIFATQLEADTRVQVLLPLALLLLAIVVIRTRKFLAHLNGSEQSSFHEGRAGNAVSGLIYYLKNGIVIGLIPFVIYRILSWLGLLTNRLDQLLNGITIAIGFVIAAIALFRIFLAPGRPDLRITNVRDPAARKIFTILFTGVFLAVAIFVLHRTAVVLVSPLEVSVGLTLIFSFLVGGTSLWALFVARGDRRIRILENGESEKLTGFWFYLIWAAWITSIVILLSAIIGYVAFAEFLSQQLLFGLVVVLSAWLLLRFVDYVFTTAPAEVANDADENPSSGQASILGAGVIKLSVYVVAGALLLLPWGYRTADFFEIFKELFFGFEIGGLRISVSTLLLAFILFFVGYTVTVALRNWLNNKFLPTTELDIGISNSISTVFGYLGFILAAILAISAAGFDLSNLAIVAGALSVGVGFGLQSIVNNFVSGLILLAERPIKAGDWVSTSGGEGYVKKISVRSTEIETFDRAMVIVPNSTLITDNVTNWTHSGKSGRIIIPVGVGYDSDPAQVQEILLNCAKEHSMVLGRPSPVVYFMDFGASSLDFQLRCFLSDINYSVSVQSDLRFEILKQLRAAKIEIPFPQRDIHIKSNAADKPVKKAAAKQAPARKRPRQPRQRDADLE